jgi:hypothetical protein
MIFRAIFSDTSFSEDLVKARLVSAVVLASVVAFGAAGCGFTTPQATSYQYAPSDGVSINASDTVKVRNALIIVNDDETAFNLTMTTVNEAESDQTMTVTIVLDGERISEEVTVPPRTTLFGNPEKGQETVVFSDLALKAGQTAQTFFEVDGSGEVRQYVPILDGTLVEYKPYVLN